MRIKALFSALLVLACLPSPLRAQSGAAAPKPRIEAGFASDRLARIDQMMQRSTAPGVQRLLILSKADRVLSIVDPVTLKIVGRVPAGPDPHEVVSSADGTRAYISNYGGGAYNTLTVVDLVNQKSLGTIDLGALRGPHGLAVAGGKVWFTAEPAKAVGSYDPATNKIDWILGTGQNGTHMIYVFPDLSRVVTTNIGSGSVTFIEKRAGPRPDWDAIAVPAGGRVEGFDVSPDGKQVWAANAQDGTITIIEVASKTVMSLAANVRGANRLKFTPDGKLVLVSTLGGPDLTIIRASDRREVKRIPVGRGAAGIQIQPDGLRAFVACSPDDYVAVVDLKTFEVVGRIDAGKNPDGLAWAATVR
jgi:DNA-binding beta-propeller fold protein YncE